MVTQNIQLGPKETKLFFTLEEEGRSIFTANDAKRILGSGPAYWLVISGLKKKGRIREIQKGKFAVHSLPWDQALLVASLPRRQVTLGSDDHR